MTIANITLVLVAISSLLALRASSVPIRNSIDDFIDDLNRQSRWARAAGVVAVIAAFTEIVRLFL